MTVWTWLEFLAWLRTLRDPGVFGPLLGLLLVGLIVPVLLFGIVTGGNHLDAPYEPTGIRTLFVCPSAAHHIDELVAAVQDWEQVENCPVPSVGLDMCEGAPVPLTMRVRGCTDVVSGTPGCSGEQWDNVSVNEGLIYLEHDAPPNVMRHVLGHSQGHGHATAASSWMARVPGDEPTGIRCGE